MRWTDFVETVGTQFLISNGRPPPKAGLITNNFGIVLAAPSSPFAPDRPRLERVLNYIFRPSMPLKHLSYVESTGQVRFSPPRVAGFRALILPQSSVVYFSAARSR